MVQHIVYRKAVESDAEKLIAFSAKTFTDTFGHIYNPVDLQAFLDKHTPETAIGWMNENFVYLALDGDEIAGFVTAGPCSLPHKDVSKDNGEIKKLYVDIPYFGTGIAKVLFNKAMEWTRETFPGDVYLGVFSENLRAQNFYKKYGFEQVGTYLYPVGNHNDLEFIFKAPNKP
ncbi:hypothetical protein HDV06_001145 [Boothiomyces sp. JEL0866]|nr:hypothetical protein HDV06_001145 [Boothiomyces sp. JEL0866]